ncbi:MAG: hypothetical protein HQL22_04535, partial [Candidatus Omnitrophica bacterium]|nr:hypothetical protein [Candidatus Omnitrophota bacterium]
MGRINVSFLVLALAINGGAFAMASDALSPGPAVSSPSSIAPDTQNNFEYTLNTLKESVGRLSEENRNMLAANEQIRGKLRMLNDQLKADQDQGTKIAAQLQSLEPRYQKRIGDQSLWEGQLKEAANRQDAFNVDRLAAEKAYKLKEMEDDALVVQVGALSRELADIRSGLVPGEDHTAELVPLRDRQASLQKELDRSTADLDKVRQEWKDLTVAINAGPLQVEQFSKEQVALKSDLAARQSQIDGLRQKIDAAAKDVQLSETIYSPQNMEQTEKEVQALEVQAQALDKDTSDLEKTARAVQTPATPDSKLKKDEARFKELLVQNKDLKMGLGNLQRKMVSLDKKKSDLEKDLDKS